MLIVGKKTGSVGSAKMDGHRTLNRGRHLCMFVAQASNRRAPIKGFSISGRQIALANDRPRVQSGQWSANTDKPALAGLRHRNPHERVKHV